MLNAECDGDRTVWVEPQEVRTLVPCPKEQRVTATECHAQYVDAEAKIRRAHPCFHCPVGDARRVALAGGFKEPAPRRGGRPPRPGRRTPVELAREKGVHLFEAVKAIRPSTTAVELRSWVEARRWPDYTVFRRELAQKLGVQVGEVAWR